MHHCGQVADAETRRSAAKYAKNRVRLGARLEQHRPLWSKRRGAFAGGQRLVVKDEGFAVGLGAACRRRGEARVAGGVRPRRGFVVVVRQ